MNKLEEEIALLERAAIPEGSNYAVIFQDQKTGTTVEAEMDLPWGEGSLFWLTEGNYSCDCNRSVFFSNYPPPYCSDELYKIIGVKAWKQ